MNYMNWNCLFAGNFVQKGKSGYRKVFERKGWH